MADICIIGADIGTTSLRVNLYGADGHHVAEGRVAHSAVHPRPGWAEMDADLWWTGFCDGCRQALAQSSNPTSSIAALSITHMRQTFVCVDTAMRPLRPAILWYDTRCAAQVEWAAQTIGRSHVYRRTGTPPTRRAIYKVMWLRDNEPEVFRKIHKVLFISDFLIHRLTGNLVTCPGVAATSGCLDVQQPTTWATDIIGACQMPEDIWIKDILPGGSVAGRVTTEAAQATGLPVGLPVVLAAGDQACGNLGGGVTTPGTLGINAGTSCALQLLASRLPMDVNASSDEITHFVDYSPNGAYIAENGITAGGAALLEWLRSGFATDLDAEAERQGRVVWDMIYDDMVMATPPGNLGLMLVPFLRGANGPYWDPRARGILVGLLTSHSRNHLARALVEGLAYEARRIANSLAAHTATGITGIHMYGGSSRSDVWNQTFADVLNSPVTTTETAEPVSLGAAICAGAGAGLYRDMAEAARMMVRIRRVYEPNPATAALYERLYCEVYQHLYQKIADLAHHLSVITSIP